jgi:hypothetical protein
VRRRLRNEPLARRRSPPAATAIASGSTTTTPPFDVPLPQGRSPPSPLCLPGGPSTVSGQGGGPLAFTGFGFGVAFGGSGVARGVARGVGGGVTRGVARGVGAGVAVGGEVGVGFALGFEVGGLVGPAAGREDGALGPTATSPLGSGVTVGPTLADGCVDAGGVGVAIPGDPGCELVVGVRLGPAGDADEGGVTRGVGTTATPPGSVRGAPNPTARAKVASTRLRTPRATTSRARWAEVTSLVLSFRPAYVGRSALSRMPEC